MSAQLLELLAALPATYGLTAVIASHSVQVAASCDRVSRIEAGVLHDGAALVGPALRGWSTTSSARVSR